jgi:hypothetical protein
MPKDQDWKWRHDQISTTLWKEMQNMDQQASRWTLPSFQLEAQQWEIPLQAEKEVYALQAHQEGMRPKERMVVWGNVKELIIWTQRIFSSFKIFQQYN